MAKKKKQAPPGRIVENRRARHDYHIEERFEAGIALMGWEVKSLRAGKAQLVDSYVVLKDGEAFLIGAHIPPLASASTHVVTDSQRTRRLLLHRKELAKLFSATQAKGRTAIATAMFWKGHLVKVEVALAIGKKQHDKRAAAKDQDWQREKARVMKHG